MSEYLSYIPRIQIPTYEFMALLKTGLVSLQARDEEHFSELSYYGNSGLDIVIAQNIFGEEIPVKLWLERIEGKSAKNVYFFAMRRVPESDRASIKRNRRRQAIADAKTKREERAKSE